MEKTKVLLLFSGGKDSFLSACRLINDGYQVYLVTYDNGCELGINNAAICSNRLIKVFGEENVKFVGIHSIAELFKSFFAPIFNMKPSEVSELYGQLPISQLNCLMCRSSMYIYSIGLCQALGINVIAEGARRDQQFAIEQKEMTDLYCELLKSFGIDLLLPVVDVANDFAAENELLRNGFVPKTFESQCLLGCPVDDNYPINEEAITATTNFFTKEILGKIPVLVKKWEHQ